AQSSLDRPAGIEYIIDQNDITTFYQKIHLVVVWSQHPLAPPEIVPVKRDIEVSFQDLKFQFFGAEQRYDLLQQDRATGLNSNEANFFIFAKVLNELFLQPPKGQLKTGWGHYFTSVLHARTKITKE